MKRRFLITGVVIMGVLLGGLTPAFSEEEEWDWGTSTQYMRLKAGYTFHAINFAPDASSEFQEFAFGDEGKYEARLGLGYINKFAQQAVHFGLGGSFYPWEALAVSLDTAFAPTGSVLPRQKYGVGLWYELTAPLRVGIDYRFLEYKQANLHELEPAIRMRLLSRLEFQGRYLFNRRGGFDNQGFELRADFQPFRVVTLSGLYGRSQHDFEPAAPDNPFKSYSAHDFGGGCRIFFSSGSGLFFDYKGQDRNNGQTYHTYTIGTFFELG